MLFSGPERGFHPASGPELSSHLRWRHDRPVLHIFTLQAVEAESRGRKLCFPCAACAHTVLACASPTQWAKGRVAFSWSVVGIC